MTFPASNSTNTSTMVAPSRGNDPFSAGGNVNIFDAMNQRKAQDQQPGNTAMPEGMPQHPPQQPQHQHRTEQPMANSMTGGQQAPGHPVQPQGQQQPSQQSASPLDEFAPKADNNSEGAPTKGEPQQPQQQASIFDTKVEDLVKVAERQDYAGEISPEVMQQIMQGDVSALSGLLNQVGRRAFANAAFAANRMASSGVAQKLESFQSDTLPNVLKDESFAQARSSINHSILQHPSVAPLVDAQMNNLRNQFPNASPQEITSMTEKYFETFAAELTGAQQQQEQEQQTTDAPNDLQKLFGF